MAHIRASVSRDKVYVLSDRLQRRASILHTSLQAVGAGLPEAELLFVSDTMKYMQQ